MKPRRSVNSTAIAARRSRPDHDVLDPLRRDHLRNLRGTKRSNESAVLRSLPKLSSRSRVISLNADRERADLVMPRSTSRDARARPTAISRHPLRAVRSAATSAVRRAPPRRAARAPVRSRRARSRFASRRRRAHPPGERQADTRDSDAGACRDANRCGGLDDRIAFRHGPHTVANRISRSRERVRHDRLLCRRERRARHGERRDSGTYCSSSFPARRRGDHLHAFADPRARSRTRSRCSSPISRFDIDADLAPVRVVDLVHQDAPERRRDRARAALLLGE